VIWKRKRRERVQYYKFGKEESLLSNAPGGKGGTSKKLEDQVERKGMLTEMVSVGPRTLLNIQERNLLFLRGAKETPAVREVRRKKKGNARSLTAPSPTPLR